MGLTCEDILIAFKDSKGYRHQLSGVIVIEMIAVWESPCQSGIGAEHGIHLLGVAREDDEHVRVWLREYGEQ